MGRLLLDLEAVNQRSADRLKQQATDAGKGSFALAWLMDETTDERERGVTVDIATHSFETDKARFTILDAPGHRDFIPNMIAGVSQADFAVLVVDAGANSFESGLKGQTKEHALLARSMGIARIIVAINKMDAVSWSEDRFRQIEQQMTAFLTSLGFQAKLLAFVPCAGLTGENVYHKAAASKMTWYSGRSLVEELEASQPAKRLVAQPLRLTIADVFRASPQIALSISGRLETGGLQVGEQIIIMPANERAIVRGLEVAGENADYAVAGYIATLHLANIDPVHVRIGDVVCTPENPMNNISVFVAKVLAFEHVLPSFVEVHRGRLHVPGRVVELVATLNKETGQAIKKRPKVVQPGSLARVRVELQTAVPLEVPGRVVLRADGLSIAAGLLEEVLTS